MAQAHTIFVRTKSDEDNTNPATVLDIVKSRHDHVINHGFVEGYWRGFPEETLKLTILDLEEFVLDTVQEIKSALGSNSDYIYVEQSDITVM